MAWTRYQKGMYTNAIARYWESVLRNGPVNNDDNDEGVFINFYGLDGEPSVHKTLEEAGEWAGHYDGLYEWTCHVNKSGFATILDLSRYGKELLEESEKSCSEEEDMRRELSSPEATGRI